MRKRTPINAALFVAAFAAVAAPGIAHATPGFPGEIQSHLKLAAQPPSSCSLCHTTGSAGGKGTVNTPFGVSVRGHGAAENDSAALDSALDAMDKDSTDSDGDGVPDITELRNGTDPNVNDVTGTKNDAGQPGGGATNGSAPEPPQYGCALAPAGTGIGRRSATRDVPFAFGAVALSMALVRLVQRRRRRHE